MRKLILFVSVVAILCAIPDVRAQNPDVGAQITSQFSRAITGFGTQIEQYAERLFWSLAACSLVWTGSLSALSPLFKAQIATCVRLLARVFRSRPFTWTLTVASVMCSSRAIALLDSPFTRQPSIWLSRSDRPT